MPKHAYVTFLFRNNRYLPGALLFAYALRRQQTRADIVCLVSQGVSWQSVKALKVLYDAVIHVDEIFVDNLHKHERADLPYLFTRFNALRLGNDGDLGRYYDKIVAADADVLPLRRYDSLFALDTPAGILNERPEHFLRCDHNGRYIVAESVYATGEWMWHEAYNPICPHGRKIPAHITDRVKTDPQNMGVNSSLYVLSPHMADFDSIVRDISREDVRAAVGRFRWPEMQYLTMAWSGRWHNIDLRFCGFNGYPHSRVLHGLHFAGRKPWLAERLSDPKSLARILRFPDVALWFRYFRGMAADYPEVLRAGRVRRLWELVRG